ncbi:MAG TPA: hypothetical protein PKC54_14550 [Ferruginibacter sp.]|nr:hypothetical protein [Ferruginibacter sp.]
MAFENFPGTEKSTEMSPPPANTNWRNYLTAGLVVALLGTWGYIIWDKNQTKETIQQKETVIANTTSQRDQLQKELEEATMRYDMIKTSSADMAHTKDSIITKQDRDISQKRIKIQQLLAKVNATEAELNEAKSLIGSLNTDILSYKTKIETLEGEKIVLTQEKNMVTLQRDKVLRDLDSAKGIISQKDEVIDVASTLHASNFSILGINEKSSGKEKTTTVAKRVDKLRISFDIDENRTATSGTKYIYVCVFAPDGNPVTVESLGSGKFNTRDGKEKPFTQKIDVNYTQGQRQTLSIDLKQASSFATGDYKIEVYNNGFKIGEGIRSLKKGGIFS